MKVLVLTYPAGTVTTEGGPQVVHGEVWRDTDTGALTASRTLTPLPPDPSEAGAERARPDLELP